MGLKLQTKKVLTYTIDTIRIDYIHFIPNPRPGLTPENKKIEDHEVMHLGVAFSLGGWTDTGEWINDPMSDVPRQRTIIFKDKEVEDIFAAVALDVKTGTTVSRALKNALYEAIRQFLKDPTLVLENNRVI